MSRVYLICGKICSGKSYYAKALREQRNAVILSTDEATFDLIDNEQGEFYNVFAAKVNRYLRKKAAEICRAGADVILDWGFWTKENRSEITGYFAAQGVDVEWHYMDVSDDVWQQNIAERNERVSAGKGGSDFYVDEGLLRKLNSMFEVPDREEIDVWHNVAR